MLREFSCFLLLIISVGFLNAEKDIDLDIIQYPEESDKINIVIPIKLPEILPAKRSSKFCKEQCMLTSEYNPVCGSDGVTYKNPSSLKCEFNCGKMVEIAYEGKCRGNSRG